MKSEDIEFCKEDYEKSDDGKLWFSNVAILHDSVFNSVIEGLSKLEFSNADVVKLIAITSLYLKSDLELVAHRVTHITMDALEKRFILMSKLIDTFPISKSFLRKDFLNEILWILDKMKSLEASKSQSEFIYGDKTLDGPIAKLIVYLEALLYDMQVNFWLKRWLITNGYVVCEISVLYHCFFIPIIPLVYAKQFSRKEDETVIEKIEYYCFCKLKITDRVPILYRNQYYMVECIFDPFKGRYLGMLDMIGYVSKLINPMRYEIKHMLTLAKIIENDKESVRAFSKDIPMKLTRLRKYSSPV